MRRDDGLRHARRRRRACSSTRPGGRRCPPTTCRGPAGDPDFVTVADRAKREVLRNGPAHRGRAPRGPGLQVCTDELRLRDHGRGACPALRSPSCSWPSTATASTCGPASSSPVPTPTHSSGGGALAREQLPDPSRPHRRPRGRPGPRPRAASTVLDELCTRFQQTAAAGHGQGDRRHRALPLVPLAGANEVGGDPPDPACSPADAHAFAAQLQRPTGRPR